MKPWFVVKRFGLGLSPRGFGWVVTAIFIVLLVLAAAGLKRAGHPGLLGPAILLLLLGFFVVMVLTSDRKPWHWRWGKDNDA